MAPFAEDLGEREYISQYSQVPVSLSVFRGGVPGDADANAVTVKMTNLDETSTIFDRPADHDDVGLYSTTLTSAESGVPGVYKVTWTYSIDSVPQTFVGLVEVGRSSATYDRLSVGMKGIVESVWIRFADLFDSPNGGPHLQVYFQSRFDRGRMSQLLSVALGRLNTLAQPHTTYSLTPEQGEFPVQQWGDLLGQGLYIECIKHLIRSYVEQPEAQGVTVARFDRRDYMSRWQTVLEMEERDYKNQLDVFKIAHMGLGSPAVLVSGGVYGDWGPTRLPGLAAARGMWRRYY